MVQHLAPGAGRLTAPGKDTRQLFPCVLAAVCGPLLKQRSAGVRPPSRQVTGTGLHHNM